MQTTVVPHIFLVCEKVNDGYVIFLHYLSVPIVPADNKIPRDNKKCVLREPLVREQFDC